MSIGKFAREVILANAGMKNDDILKIVRAQFPDAKTSYACIAWYKSDMKKKGLLVVKPVRTAELVMAELEALEAKQLELLAELDKLMAEAGGDEPADEEDGGDEQPQEEVSAESQAQEAETAE